MSTTTLLPSFVELMASLGLDNARDRAPSSHSRSSSVSSGLASVPASRTHSRAPSESSLHEEAKRVPPTRRLARYSPYTPAISSIRRRSQPCTLDVPFADKAKSYPGTPVPGSPNRGFRSDEFQAECSDAEVPASMPISTYARRRTPQTSPITAAFPCYRKRDNPPPMPFTAPSSPLFTRRPAAVPFTPASSPSPPPRQCQQQQQPSVSSSSSLSLMLPLTVVTDLNDASPSRKAHNEEDDRHDTMPFVLPTLPTLVSPILIPTSCCSSGCSSPTAKLDTGSLNLRPYGHPSTLRLSPRTAYRESPMHEISPVA